jgi:hypothetical protein
MGVISDTKKIMQALKSPVRQSNIYDSGVLDKIKSRSNGFVRRGVNNNGNPMSRYGQGDTGSGGMTTIYEPFLNPLIDRQHLEFPKDRVKRNERFWDYFSHDAILNQGIRLLVEYPISNFTLVHEDHELEDFYNETAERLDLLALLMNIGIQYYVIGEAIPFGFVDNPADPHMWTDFILLNPDWATIHRHPAIRPRSNGSFGKYSIIYEFHRDPSLRKIIETGPSNPATSDLFKQVPEDILKSVKQRLPIKLPDVQASYFQRIGNYFTGRGESVIQSCLLEMMYRDKLREANYAIIDRHASPTEFYKIGETGQPATAEELEAFDSAMQSVWNGFNKAVIWHHALQVDWQSGNGKTIPVVPEMQFIEKRVLSALGLSEAFFYGSGPSFANASVSLEVLICRFLTYRQTMENFLLKQIFQPLCIWNNLYEEPKKSTPDKYRVRNQSRKMKLPTIKWDKQNLREDREKINMLAGFCASGVIPYEMLWQSLNLDKNMVMEKLKKQLEQIPNAPNILTVQTGPGKGLPGEQMGLPGGIGGGIGTPEAGFGGEMEGDLMGGEGPVTGAPGAEVIPPEAHEEPGLPTSV